MLFVTSPIVEAPVSVSGPVVSVPIAPAVAPGLRLALAATVTAPVVVPEPARVAPALTVVTLPPVRVPFTKSVLVPPTVVVPV